MKHHRDLRVEVCDSGSEHKTIDIVLCSGFSMLDLASAIEPLALVNRLTGQDHYQWRVLSLGAKEVRSSNGLEIPVDAGICGRTQSRHVFVCAFEHNDDLTSPQLLSWLRRQARKGAMLGALGNGAAVLINAGVVGARKFTLHWSLTSGFCERHPEQTPVSQIFTSENGLMTSAGGRATTDMMLTLIGNDFDEELAAKVADHLLSGAQRQPNTEQRLSRVHRYGTRDEKFLSIMETLEADVHFEMKVDDILAKHKLSRRQLERLFNRYCGISPSRFLKRMRLERARELLEQTDMNVLQVAVACGFGTAACFSNSFAQQFGCRPSLYGV